MSDFKGKVKKANTDKTNHDEFETIVVIQGDVNNEVEEVKVTYPAWTDPNPVPVNCQYSYAQGGDRYFKDGGLSLGADVIGQSVTLEIEMIDTNGNVIGTGTATVIVADAI